MAIYPLRTASGAAQLRTSSTQPNPIEVLTEQTSEANFAASLSDPSSGPSNQGPSELIIDPLDKQSQRFTNDNHSGRINEPRRKPVRRDSLDRREALLKGKEGSRRRQRWENDRLLSNPWAQPPLPSDWEVQPTHPRYHPLPYFLAPLWDADQAARKATESKKKRQQGKSSDHDVAEDASEQVPKLVKEKLKRARAARGLLMDLEEEVRKFAREWKGKEASLHIDEAAIDRLEFDFLSSDEEEEIVFVGRGGTMLDRRLSRDKKHLSLPEKLVFDSLASDHGASFGRWLVHSLATYYQLRTWSITTDDTPARREAYVGIPVCPPSPLTTTIAAAKNKGKTAAATTSPNIVTMRTGRRVGNGDAEDDWLPRPLWGMV